MSSDVFVNGHALDCERDLGYDCDCGERFEHIFNRCYECRSPLDEDGECTTPEEHYEQ